MKILVRAALLAGLLLVALVSTHAGSGAARAASESGQQPLEDFVPSEKLPADSAISFPVDI
jgi:hypothetical protein